MNEREGIATELKTELKSLARGIGFDLVGVSPAVVPPGFPNFLDWLDRGFAGEMNYLPKRRAAYEHPRHVLDAVRSVVMLAVNYRTVDPTQPGPNQGRVSRYAWGARDYHEVIWERLDQLSSALERLVPGAKSRGVVDTAPLLERDFARLAGLGWFGKNTLLINKRAGSWLFLAALLTDIELPADSPHEASHCGTCTRCLDACPTDAFVSPFVLDARRCLSYLTIELRGPIPDEFRPGMGDWLFGCDICQDVCPWNRKSPRTADPIFHPSTDLAPADALALLSLSEDQFRQRFRHTPLFRTKRDGLLRNACIVLGNVGDAGAVPRLLELAATVDVCSVDDSKSEAKDANRSTGSKVPPVSDMVREAARWAVRRIRERLGPDELSPDEPSLDPEFDAA